MISQAVIRFAFFTREILLVRFRAVLIRPFLRGAFAGKWRLILPFPHLPTIALGT